MSAFNADSRLRRKSDPAKTVELAVRVYTWLLEHTETWGPRPDAKKNDDIQWGMLGAEVAYLLGAILKGVHIELHAWRSPLLVILQNPEYRLGATDKPPNEIWDYVMIFTPYRQ